MQPIDNKVLYRIYGRGRGWAFTKTDFAAEFGEANIHKSLSTLEKSGKIRRLARGLYDYPAYSELLKKELSPDMDQVANAYARKFNWRITVSGETALSILALSTQVPANYVYLSDGPSRRYEVLNQTLEFRKSTLKDMGFKLRESTLLVQALKALGKEHISPDVISKIRSQLDPSRYERILKDTRTSTGWVYEAIRQICRSGADG